MNCCSSSDISQANKFLLPEEKTIPPKNFCYFLKHILRKLDIKGAVGIPGTSTLYFYEQIEKDPEWKNNFFVHHEMNSGFLADGSVRGSKFGKRNFYLSYATTGPGSCNIVTSVADSISDNIPAIHLVNDNGAPNLDNYYFVNHNRNIQNIPPENIFGGVAKCIYRMTIPAIQNGTVVQGIVQAFQKSFSYPQGALIMVLTSGSGNYLPTEEESGILTKAIQEIPDLFVSNEGIQLKPEYIIPSLNPVSGYLVPIEWDIMVEKFNSLYGPKVIPSDPFEFLNESLRGKQKPIVILGVGVEPYVSPLIDFFTKKAKIPHIVTLPLMGFIRPDPYAIGRCGHTAQYQGNYAAYYCDWVLCIGNSFNYYSIPSDLPSKNFAHASHVISWNLYPQLTDVPFVTNYIINEAKNVMEWEPLQQDYSGWIDLISQWKKKGHELLQPVFYKKSPFLQYGTVFEVIQKVADNFIKKYPSRRIWLCSDVGLNQPLGCTLFIFRDDRYKFVTGGKLGAVGGGLGIAMGVALANPEDLIILYSGDTGIQFNMPDWISIKESGIQNMILFIFENSGIGLIEEEDTEQKSGNLLYANGYKNTADWKSLFSANLFSSTLWTKNCRDKEALVQKISSHCLKGFFVTLCVVEYDVYYSPIVALGHSFIDMQYFPGGKDPRFQQKRIELIEHCNPLPTLSQKTIFPSLMDTMDAPQWRVWK